MQHRPSPAEPPSSDAPRAGPGADGPTVVLLGGGRDALAISAGVPTKAHLPVEGRPLVARVLAALAGAERVGEIVYVGEPPVGLGQDVAVTIPPGERFEDSFALGAGAALGRGAKAMVVTTADLPWLTPPCVDDFVQAAQATGADVVYPVVAERVMEAAFPEQKRTYLRLTDGRFTGGNMAYVTSRAVSALLPVLSRAYRDRKNPFALAGFVGLGILVKLLVGRASLADAEDRVSRLIGAPGRAVVSTDAAIAADVDRLDHLPGVLAPLALEGART